jgi:hypothetical protein
MVILGAGASYDFSWRRPVDAYSIPERLPLANQLFDEVFGNEVNPACRGLMRRLRDAAKRAVIEQTLEEIREEAQSHPYLRRQLVGVQHYLRAVIQRAQSNANQLLPDGVTNHIELVHEIEKWRGKQDGKVCFVTFNYDTLLEDACTGVINDFHINNIEDYWADPRYKIVKLHGSTDWTEMVPAKSPRSGWSTPGLDDVDTIWELPRDGSFIQLHGNQTQNTFAFPAIAIPTVTKTDRDFFCPENHLTILREQIATVTHLLVVGWRGAEDHFHKVWRESSTGSLKRFGFVDLDIPPDKLAGSETKTRVRISLGLKGEERFYSNGFSHFTQTLGIQEFLAK